MSCRSRDSGGFMIKSLVISNSSILLISFCLMESWPKYLDQILEGAFSLVVVVLLVVDDEEEELSLLFVDEKSAFAISFTNCAV